jgi:hypothetical protein
MSFVLFLSVVLLTVAWGRALRRGDRLAVLLRKSRRRKARVAEDLDTTLRALGDARGMYLGAVAERDAAMAEQERREVQAQSEAFAAAAKTPPTVMPAEVATRNASMEVLESQTTFGLVVNVGVPRDAGMIFAVRWGAA